MRPVSVNYGTGLLVAKYGTIPHFTGRLATLVPDALYTSLKGSLWFYVDKGVTDPLRPCGPSSRPLQGPDVRLPKNVTLRRGNAAARAVIAT